MAAALILSFCSVGADNRFTFGSLDGYRAVFAGGRIDEFVKILVRASTVTLVTLMMSVPTAYHLARMRRPRLRTFLLAVLITPWLVSDMLRAFGWQLLLSPAGPVSKLWSVLTGLGPLESLRYNFTAVVVGLVSAMMPAGVLSVLAALPNRSKTEWLAASEIGRPYHVFTVFALGRARPGIIVGVCVVFVLSCFGSAEPRFLDGPTQTSIQTIAASLVNDGVPALLAFGTLLTGASLFSCVLAAAMYRLSVRPRQSGEGDGKILDSPVSLKVRNNRLFDALSGRSLDFAAKCVPPLALVLSVIVACAPLLAVAAEAFWQPDRSGGRWTVQNFQQMLSSEQLGAALANSGTIAAVAALFASAIAFVLSLVVWNPPLQRWVLILAAALVIVPGDAYAISLLQLLKFLGNAEGGWLLVVIAHVLWAVPFATGTLVLANRHISENVLLAGLEYSSGPLAVIARIVARINFGRIAGVALLAATLSLNEYTRASYLSGRLLTVANEVHGRLTAGLLPNNRGIFAAELVVFAISVIAVVVTLSVVQSQVSSSRLRSRLLGLVMKGSGESQGACDSPQVVDLQGAIKA